MLPKNSKNITVVIPFYNDSKTLGRALESVKVQTLPPLEVIVVDDASGPVETQRLRDIVSTFREVLDIRVYRHSSNRGPSAARNYAWNQARGELVAFLDSDDSWLPQKLEIQSEVMSTMALGIVGTGGELNSPPIYYELKKSYPVQKVGKNRQLLQNHFRTSSVMLHRENPLRFKEDLRYSEDNHLWCRILLAGHKGALLELPLTSYHKPTRSRSGLSGNFWKMFLGQIEVYRSLYSEKKISLLMTILCYTSSTLRFARRYLLVIKDWVFSTLR